MIDESTKNYLIENGWKYVIRHEKGAGLTPCEVFVRDWYCNYTLELHKNEGSLNWFGRFLSPKSTKSVLGVTVGEGNIFRALLELLDNIEAHFNDLNKSIGRLRTQTLEALPKNQVHIMSHGHLLCHLVDAPSKLPEGHKWISYWNTLDGIRSLNEDLLPSEEELCPECLCMLRDIRGRERIWHKVGSEKNQIY